MPKKEVKKGITLRISLDEYEALRAQAKTNDKVITDPDMIKTIDKIEDLVTTLRKRIVRKDMYKNILLHGGTTLFEGFAERLRKEINFLSPPRMEAKVIAPPERKYTAWIGASVLAALDAFKPMWITKDEYDEVGPSIINTHKKGCKSFFSFVPRISQYNQDSPLGIT